MSKPEHPEGVEDSEPLRPIFAEITPEQQAEIDELWREVEDNDE